MVASNKRVRFENPIEVLCELYGDWVREYYDSNKFKIVEELVQKYEVTKAQLEQLIKCFKEYYNHLDPIDHSKHFYYLLSDVVDALEAENKIADIIELYQEDIRHLAYLLTHDEIEAFKSYCVEIQDRDAILDEVYFVLKYSYLDIGDITGVGARLQLDYLQDPANFGALEVTDCLGQNGDMV